MIDAVKQQSVKSPKLTIPNAPFSCVWRAIHFLSIKDLSLLFSGILLAVIGGAGLPHLVFVVGKILDIFISVDPFSDAFRAKITPILLYYVILTVVLLIIANFQYICFRIVALKLARRLRRGFFHGIASRPASYFADPTNAVFVNRFEADIADELKAVEDALPFIIGSFAQLITAFLHSFYASPALAIPVAIVGGVCFIVCAIANVLIAADVKRTAGLGAWLKDNLLQRSSFEKWATSTYGSQLRVGIITGLVSGLFWFFLYSGMGISCWYGNYFIDNHTLSHPGHIFAIACSIVPACFKAALLIGHLNALFAIGNAVYQVERLGESRRTETMSNLQSVDQTSVADTVRKTFLTTIVKSMITGYHETLHFRNCPTFLHIRQSIFSKTSIVGFILCICFAAAPPTFTKLNGDLYEFYTPVEKSYYDDGYRMSIFYYGFGGGMALLGFAGYILFARNGENVAHILRNAIYDVFQRRSDSEITTADTLKNYAYLTKTTVACKSAFDFRLATFVVGLFNLFFGIGFVYEKNLASATITTICFIVQAICQYFMARAAEIHTKRNVAKRNAHALKVANSFEAMTVEEFSSKLPVIGAEFNNLLAFHHQRLMTFVPTQALRYAAATALPQVTQAVAYTLGCFLVSEGLVRPVVLYKVVQTLYMSAFSFASVVSYSLDVHNSRVGCHQLDDVVNVKEASGKANGIRVWAA